MQGQNFYSKREELKMRTTREGCFETNSSSSHSFVYEGPKDVQDKWDIPTVKHDQFNKGVVPLTLDYFGHSYGDDNRIADPFIKLQYLLTFAYETECNPKFMASYVDENGVKRDFFTRGFPQKPTKTAFEIFRETQGYQSIQRFLREQGTKGIDEEKLAEEFELSHYHFPPQPEYWYVVSKTGRIDHQSYETYDSLADYLHEHKVSLEEFVLNSNAVLYIESDN